MAEEAAVAAKAAAAAAADLALTSREILSSKSEGGIKMEFSLFYCMNLYPKHFLIIIYIFFLFHYLFSISSFLMMVNGLQS